MGVGGRTKKGKYSPLVDEMGIEFDDPQAQIPIVLPLVSHTLDGARSGLLPLRYRSGVWMRLGDAGAGADDIDLGIDLTPAQGHAIQLLALRVQVIDGLNGAITWQQQGARTATNLDIYQAGAGGSPVDGELIATGEGTTGALGGEGIEPQDPVQSVIVPPPAVIPNEGEWYDIRLAQIAGALADVSILENLPLLFRTSVQPFIEVFAQSLAIRYHRTGTVANDLDLLIVRVSYSVANFPRVPIRP